MMRRLVFQATHWLTICLDACAPLGNLVVRVWVAYIFFTAGLIKAQSWVTTLNLFNYEYHVPFLPPTLAAILATTIELVWPVLLVLGLGGRLMYFVLFIYNAMAVVSYPYLWTPEGYAGLLQHLNWGLLIMLLMFYGSDKWSLDHWLQQRHHYKPALPPITTRTIAAAEKDRKLSA